MDKRGQNNASNAAILVIIITTLIVLYILFLPPTDRAELLGESSTSGTSSSGSSPSSSSSAPAMTLLQENVGHITSLNKDEVEHNLPAFSLSTKTGGSVIKEVSSVYVKSSVFDAVIKNVSFNADPDTMSSLKLSFNVGAVADGRLIILLNNQQIFNDQLKPKANGVVKLPSDLLQRYNVLTIGVSSPGWAFWQANEYTLSSFQITGNVQDLSGAQSRQSFTLSQEEVQNIDHASLRFYAECSKDAGRLIVKVNGRTMSDSFIDCNVLNTIELDNRYLDVGENDVLFSVDGGDYQISNLMVKTYLQAPIYPIYYFDVDQKYFTAAKDTGNEMCGEVDGICPDGCTADEDKDCCADDRGYWCDVPTAQLNDRCVSFVTESTCGRCASGYEDYRGRAPDACEGLCGDDKDGKCPTGCSAYYDKDCCFANNDYYWCDDAPVAQPLSAVCMAGVEPDQREYCPSTYYDDSGHRLTYTKTSDTTDELRSTYTAMLYLEFPNSDVKSGTLVINGREVGLETTRTSWEKDISSYVRPDTNSIQIEPARTMDVTSLTVKIEK